MWCVRSRAYGQRRRLHHHHSRSRFDMVESLSGLVLNSLANVSRQSVSVSQVIVRQPCWRKASLQKNAACGKGDPRRRLPPRRVASAVLGLRRGAIRSPMRAVMLSLVLTPRWLTAIRTAHSVRLDRTPSPPSRAARIVSFWISIRTMRRACNLSCMRRVITRAHRPSSAAAGLLQSVISSAR